MAVFELVRKRESEMHADKEGYPSGLRGWFAKSLDWGDLVREFESPLLRQIKIHCGCSVFLFGERGDSNSRGFAEQNERVYFFTSFHIPLMLYLFYETRAAK